MVDHHLNTHLCKCRLYSVRPRLRLQQYSTFMDNYFILRKKNKVLLKLFQIILWWFPNETLALPNCKFQLNEALSSN